MAMASKNYRTYCSTLLLIIIACQSIYIASATTRELWGLKHKGTIQSIESHDGEVIDCVDIYQQPGLENSPIKDLKMSPTSYPVGIEMNSNAEIHQDWHKYGECPEGTIPIRRSSSSIKHTKSPPFNMIQSESNHSIKASNSNGLEFAMAYDADSYYYGAYARLNVWNPKVEYGEYSASKISLISGTFRTFDTSYNSIEAGWIVYPSRYKDSRTRLYIYWTGDGYRRTGCYDLDCKGFIQTNRKYSLGAAISPVSSYGKQQYDIPFTIFQDTNTGDWWFRFGAVDLGYWPSHLFTTLNKHAVLVSWGGEVLDHRSGGHHTTTQMGSGYSSTQGFSKSALTSYMVIIDSNYTLRDPGLLQSTVTYKGCYDLKIGKEQSGHLIYFGGPGLSSTCP